MILDGKAAAEKIQEEIREKIDAMSGRKPCLAVVLVGEHAPSQIYVRYKQQACERVGITSLRLDLPSTITEEELLQEIKKLNEDPTVDGILVQLPLPKHINANKITESVSPKKDVDGFHPINIGKLLQGDKSAFVPCTPLGVLALLQYYQIEVAGKEVVILGRSNIVGKPLAALLLQNNATITLIHSKTQNIKAHTKRADILIAALGKPHFITKEMVKEGAVVIDVGINRLEGNKVVGDVAFDEVKEKCAAITPVPGGIGPMTIAMLLKNTLKAHG